MPEILVRHVSRGLFYLCSVMNMSISVFPGLYSVVMVTVLLEAKFV